MSSDDDTWHQPTWASSEWTPPSTLRVEHDAPSITPRAIESSSLAKADPPVAARQPPAPEVPARPPSALAAAHAPTFGRPSGPDFREAAGAQAWPTYGDPQPTPTPPDIDTAAPTDRPPAHEPIPVERIPTGPPPPLPERASSIPWPTRDWSRNADGSRDNGVTPGLSEQSRAARARGAWPASPTTPGGITTPQRRPVARPASPPKALKRANPRNATIGASVLTALGAGSLGLSLVDTTRYTPVFSILAVLACASLLPGKARRGNPPSRGWQSVGGILLVVNVVLVAVGFFAT